VSLGICDACAKLKRLDQAGALVLHHVTIRVSAKAIRPAPTDRVRRRCPGSGKPPRRGRAVSTRGRCGAAHCTRVTRLVATRAGRLCKRCADRLPPHLRRPVKETRR
jgi:hypothetical protein